MSNEVEVTKNIDVTMDIKVWSVVDQHGNELSILNVEADRDGDLIVKVQVSEHE